MNPSKASYFLIGLTVGVGIGGGATYVYLKDKFEKQLNEDAMALKAHYANQSKELSEKNEERKKELEDQIFSEPEVNEFVDYAKMYSSDTNEDEAIKSYNEVIEENDDISTAAEIISDVDFSDPNYDNYRKISVDYFESGAAFESLSGEELDGFEAIVGDEWKTAFGEYTPNVVYVRNHELKTDYEIIEQEGAPPHPEDE